MSATSTDKINILLVDDQPGKLLTYEAILGSLEANLITANSGTQALEVLLRNDITVVLMDVSMPEIGGFELAEIIRGHPRYQKTAIIFVSAVHLTDLDRLKGYESGAVDYVSVPVVPELLRAKVSVFIELYRKTRDAERLTLELEQRVAERTAELEAAVDLQRDLAASLREADHRKDEFLALLAHELRNPLAPIHHAVHILHAKDVSDPDVRWCRDIIERQTTQLTRLVDDLLDVSRISKGKIQLRTAPVDLALVVAAAVETSRPLISARHHELAVITPEQPVMVSGDITRLTQVVANLMNNAARYQQEHGYIEVKIEAANREAIIRVKDRGIGIPADGLPRLFDLFSQGERTPDGAHGGLGIGLSLVRTLVEMHGGSVHGSSEGQGLGSEFVVVLPAIMPEPERADPPPMPLHALSAIAPRRILVVDDNRDAAESLAMLLRLGGHEVLVAHDGPTALTIVATDRPATLILDLGLPGMDGYEICRRVRQEAATPLQIIAMTGYGQDRDRQRSSEAGFDAHTVKPVSLTELMSLLAGA